jgi:hypothetical protein
MRFNFRRADDEGHVTAAFDLGFVTGTLRLSSSKADLKTWCEPEDEEEVQEPITPSSSPPVGRQPASSSDSDGLRRSKRVKIEENDDENQVHGDRVHLQWRGLSSIGDACFLDDTRQIGWLDFPRTDGAIFWGCIDFPGSLGAGIWVQGTRTSKGSAEKPMPWDEFEAVALSKTGDIEAEEDAGKDEDAINRHRAPTAQMNNGKVVQFESDVHFEVPETQFA